MTAKAITKQNVLKYSAKLSSATSTSSASKSYSTTSTTSQQTSLMLQTRQASSIIAWQHHPVFFLGQLPTPDWLSSPDFLSFSTNFTHLKKLQSALTSYARRGYCTPRLIFGEMGVNFCIYSPPTPKQVTLTTFSHKPTYAVSDRFRNLRSL